VYDWLPLAVSGGIVTRTWRDALLAIKTRDAEHVVLGPVLADGSGSPRDMSEGVLLRLFHALECLYPTALLKEGALKWRVRSRGAGYHHLLVSLEWLGRGAVPSAASLSAPPLGILATGAAAPPAAAGSSAIANSAGASCKRPRRSTAQTKSEAAGQASSSAESAAAALDDADEAAAAAGEEYLPLPTTTTTLWAHQEASVTKVVSGVKSGRLGHADASAVGAGKTLTALATICRLAAYIEATGGKRNGVLVMMEKKALVKEWLLEIATHTRNFHVIEQREDGRLFSLTYGHYNPPVDGNSLVISTLDRVCEHPFVRQAAWDFVVIDECLSVQNADAKRCPSAWRQIEVSLCGVLMLSATFFRSKYSALFYMIRMLRTPLPRTMEWLPATIHEHIVCQVPETDRTWTMRGEPVQLPAAQLQRYRGIIAAFQRKQQNTGEADGRKLYTELECFLREVYEGREEGPASYASTSVMGEAFAKECAKLLRQKRRPLVFADTAPEAAHLLKVLQAHGIAARMWSDVAAETIATSGRAALKEGDASKKKKGGGGVIVAVKSVEGQGINMQGHADAIVCRPTPGDHLEQMKGRVDRPGQASKQLVLVVLMAEHTVEEAKFANIRLAGNFFREYIAPVATRYRERIDLEATLAAGGSGKLKRFTVRDAWARSLAEAGQTGAFAACSSQKGAVPAAAAAAAKEEEEEEEEEEEAPAKRARGVGGKAVARGGGVGQRARRGGAKKGSTDEQASAAEADDGSDGSDEDYKEGEEEEEEAPKYAPRNKVKVNKGDPLAIAQAKALAKEGRASLAVRRWLFPPKAPRAQVAAGGKKPLAKDSPLRFDDTTPPLVLTREVIHKAVVHLSKDPKLSALIARVGAAALENEIGTPRPPTQARLFDKCVRAITFTMVSVDAGNAFLRRLAMKVGVAIERMGAAGRASLLDRTVRELIDSGEDTNGADDLHKLMLTGKHNTSGFLFTPEIVAPLIASCEKIKGKQTGYPHLCGDSFPCGKNDDHELFLQKARAHAAGEGEPVSAAYSRAKADFLISLVADFKSGKISGAKMAAASDREAARMLESLKGIGNWSAGGVLMHFLQRANVMLYGDLTIRNYLNDLYEIGHLEESETLLQSQADFDDTAENRNLIDALAEAKGWHPYRSVVCYLMYHLQEENLVLL